MIVRTTRRLKPLLPEGDALRTSGALGRRLVISRTYSRKNAGLKAPSDIRRIALDIGFDPIDLPALGPTRRERLHSFCGSILVLLRHARRLRGADILLVQHPLGRLNDVLVGLLAPRDRVVTLVHDIEELRWPSSSAFEIAALGRSRVLIVHTRAMAEYLEPRLPDVRHLRLERFDYLARASPVPRHSERPHRLLFIGSLDPHKVGFLYALGQQDVPLDVYGPNVEESALPTCVTFRGLIDMDDPRLSIIDGFGLVWDGPSPTELTGAGDYLRYNAPHKFSLYMALGLPVIVPRTSAIASTVLEQGLGLVVDAVADAAVSVASVDEERWGQLISAVSEYRVELMTGAKTRRLIEEAVTAVVTPL